MPYLLLLITCSLLWRRHLRCK